MHAEELLDRVVGEEVNAAARDISGFLLPDTLVQPLKAFFVENLCDLFPVANEVLAVDLCSHLHQVDRVEGDHGDAPCNGP